MKKITTLITTFRRPALLRKAIQSVLDQTYSSFELFICDNASGDETARIVAEFSKKDPRVHYFCHPTNIGMIANYAFALLQIKTEFFSFLSDDDLLLPTFFEMAIHAFQNHPDLGFVAGSTQIVTPEKKVVRIPLSEWKKEGKFYPPLGMFEMVGKYPVPTSILFNSKILTEVNIDTENPLFWDCDYLLQIASKFPFLITKKPCALFLHHREGFSNSQDLLQTEYAFQRLLSRTENEKLRQLIQKDLARYRRSFFFRSIKRLFYRFFK